MTPKQLLRISFLFLFLGSASAQERVQTFLLTISDVAREQIDAVRSPSEIDFMLYLKPWADRLGVTEAQAKAEIEQWVAANAESPDLFKKALARFYRKDFGAAAKVLAQSVANRSEEYREKVGVDTSDSEIAREIRLQGVRELRLIGHATFLNFDFANALKAYQQALQFTSDQETPELWADILMDLGRTYSEAASRMNTTNNAEVYGNSVKAYLAAADVFTFEKAPKKWGQIQNSLGATLAIMGLEETGAKSDSLLNAGVQALRNSLKVFTEEEAPAFWARSENNLGATLAEMAIRKERAEGEKLMAAAVLAYKNSMRVRTRKAMPGQWTQLQRSIASAYAYLKDWPHAAQAYDNRLQQFPDDETAYQAAAELYQKFTFDFEKSFILTRDWVSRHPNDLKEKVKLVEKYFTSGRHSECQQQIDTYLNSEDFSVLVKIFMRVLDVANQVALNQNENVAPKLDELLAVIKARREDFSLGINIDGLVHFVETNSALAAHKDWLIQFFKATTGQDRDTIYQDIANARAAFAG